MPEIAEVETVRRTLNKKIINKKIKDVNIIYSKMLETNPDFLKNTLINKEIIDIKRIGKWLLFELDNYYLLSHLRMEGKFFLKNDGEPIEKHEHIIIKFVDNTELRYHDTRRFGKMCLVEKDKLYEYEGIRKQGYEPFDEKLTKEYLLEKFKNKKMPVKSLLLDQTIISGLGNIYADEVVFNAKINPLKKGNELSLEECQRIVDATNSIIKEAIKMGGTTIKSYTSSLGVTGLFQKQLMVHKKEGERCEICSSIIKRIKIGGRSTYYCETCQK